MSMYKGRFAPSPTGPLHLGSLIAAVGSYLEARRRGGVWYVRIEDLDQPRTVSGAADTILRQLNRFGMVWDAPPLYQSRRTPYYRQALEKLRRQGLVYRCDCPRRRLKGTVYDGRCRASPPSLEAHCAIRIKIEHGASCIEFNDAVQGKLQENIHDTAGDFIIRRRDGLFAYQLAVVVDDAAQNISHIVRGADLLESTARQIYLQQLLGLPTPAYTHLPVLLDPQGRKLSKQNHAPPINEHKPLPQLLDVLKLLGQKQAPPSAQKNLNYFWEWAAANWRPEALPRRRECAVP